MVASGPLYDNVLTCQLRPVSLAACAVPITEAQQARLAAIFPSRVCDDSKPGVGQGPPAGSWPSLGPAH